MTKFCGSLLLVGCGKMGQALYTAWQAQFPEMTFYLVDPSLSEAFVKDRTSLYRSCADISLDITPDLCVLAVKPQVMPEILGALTPWVKRQTLFISIAAGLSSAWFADNLSPDVPLLRVMPNTPASIGQGMSVLYAPKTLSLSEKILAQNLMEAVGDVAFIEDEAQMDAVTAVSGSGPAYFFKMVEALSRAGQKMGLSQELSEQLARQTFIGAGALAQATNLPCDVLRENVTSKGGTTAAALAALGAEDRLDLLMEAAVQAATDRSKELSS